MTYSDVLIPAAGRGARLDRPDTVKPLVEVDGRPLVVSLLRQFAANGVRRAVVVVGFRASEIERALYRHPDITMDVELVFNPQWEQGLAGSILAARDQLTEPFLLAMADHVFDDDLIRRVVREELGADDVRLFADRDFRRMPDLDAAMKIELTEDRVTKIGRTLPDFDAVDIGLFACRPALFGALQHARSADSSADLAHGIARLVGEGKVGARDTAGAPWFDIDTPSTLVRAEMHLRRSRRLGAVRVREPEQPAQAAFNYRFTTGAPAQTRVLLQRGFVRNPSSFQLIPEESSSSPIFVFTDERVDRLYGEAFIGDLKQAGYRVRSVVLPEGEAAKTLKNYVRLVEEVLSTGVDERSVLISLGGGSVCNVCGFIASTLYRGLGLIHVPTTLMAQCDAAISHKQGVNGSHGKNLVGSYYPPIAIAVDIDVLATLDDWLIPDGLAEVVKHALGQDAHYLDFLLEHRGSARDPDFLEMVVRRNIELKCALMSTDPKEHREGMVLQYGHEVGHPVEFLSGYQLSHGQSVAIGMAVSAEVSRIMGGASEELVAIHRRVLEQYGLPRRIPSSITIDDIMTAMRYNKRRLTEGNRLALVEAPGKLWSVDGDYAIPVDDRVLVQALERCY